jgi:hypothetical protein
MNLLASNKSDFPQYFKRLELLGNRKYLFPFKEIEAARIFFDDFNPESTLDLKKNQSYFYLLFLLLNEYRI